MTEITGYGINNLIRVLPDFTIPDLHIIMAIYLQEQSACVIKVEKSEQQQNLRMD